MSQLASRLEGIGEYYFSSKLREIAQLNEAGHKVINLGIGSPDLPPHPTVVETLYQESLKSNTHAYQPYKGSPLFLKAVADWYQEWYGVNVDLTSEVMPLMGSKEGIVHICMTYLDKGDAALVPNPGYPTYSAAVKLSGASVIDFKLTAENDYHADVHWLKSQVDEYNAKNTGRVKLMFLNYPHMPTGQLPKQQLLRELINFAIAENIIIVHDNPYSFVLNENPSSLLSLDPEKKVVIELNSLSKSHNMAGWRVGMVVASAARIGEIIRFKSNMDSGMFLPVQLAAAKALSLDKTWYDEINAIYTERKKLALSLLDLLGCRYSLDQVGMFVWAKIPTSQPSGFALSDEILDKAKVFVTPGGIFGSAGDGYIRVSLCSKKEVFEEAIERIKKALN